MIKSLFDLIAIDSSSQEGANAAIKFCADWLEQNKIDFKLLDNCDRLSLVATLNNGPKKIILNGHVDVVVGTAAQFNPRVEGDLLYGRGAVDMKAGVIAIMQLFKEVKNLKLPYSVELHLVSDEESGGFHGAKYLVDQGFHGDFVICAEPTNLNLAIEAKGILQFELTTRGIAAHGSRPWLGENAILKAYDIYRQIKELPFTKESSAYYESPSVNLSKIIGGQATNSVPNCCISTYDIRYLPQQNCENILAQIKTISDVEIKLLMGGDPVQTSSENKYVQSLQSIAKRQIQKDVLIFGQHGSADTRHYSAKGIPAIEFGPIGSDWHGENEVVSISSIEKYIAILKEFLLTKI